MSIIQTIIIKKTLIQKPMLISVIQRTDTSTYHKHQGMSLQAAKCVEMYLSRVLSWLNKTKKKKTI